MRRTAKYNAAREIARSVDSTLLHTCRDSQDALYSALAEQGYAWFAKDRQWKKTDREVDATGREKNSIFTAPDGTPTGVFRIRVMSHPDLLGIIADRIGQLFTE